MPELLLTMSAQGSEEGMLGPADAGANEQLMSASLPKHTLLRNSLVPVILEG